MAAADRTENTVFFVGILARSPADLLPAGEVLVSRFGPALQGSPVWPFSHTAYYRDELGDAPVRAFLAFPGLFATEELPERKHGTNALEQEIASAAGGASARPVNLDPGYVTPAKLVLASAKNYAHRIHIGRRIFAEVTLQYRDRRWCPLPWTFPDFASGRYDAFFTALRRLALTGRAA